MQQHPWDVNVEEVRLAIINAETELSKRLFNRQVRCLSTASIVLSRAISQSPDGMSWVKELVLPEYMSWVNEPNRNGGVGVKSPKSSPPSSPVKFGKNSAPLTSPHFSIAAKDHVSGMVLCKGVSTIKGFNSRLQRELNPPYIRSTLALRPMSLLFPGQILGADAYFRVLSIAAIRHHKKRKEATVLESNFALPTGELNFGLGVYVETLHLALLGAPIDILLKFSADNRLRIDSYEKKRNIFAARESSVSAIFHNKCIPLAIERAIRGGLVSTANADDDSAAPDGIEEAFGIQFAETPISIGALTVVFTAVFTAIRLHASDK